MSSEKILEMALKAGASAAEVYEVESLAYPVSFQSNRLKLIESSQSEGTALRLWKNGSPGLAVAYGEFDPDLLVQKAIALSHLNPVEEIELAQGRQELHPIRQEEFEVNVLIEEGKKSIEHIIDQYPDVICSANLEWERERVRLINSFGLDCQYCDDSFSFGLGVEWIRGDDFLGIYDGESNYRAVDTGRIINNMLQRLVWSERNVVAPSGKLPIIFTPSAATILWGTLSTALNSKYILESSSPWSDRLNQIVVSQDLCIRQDPTIKSCWCPFDDEGVVTQKLDFIENGIFRGFYSDLKRAKQLEITSSGNGFRSSLGSYPSPDLVNLLIDPGQGDLEQLLSDFDQGILVDQVLGQEPDISGDFSINIDLGFYVERGKIQGRIKDTMISGNVYTALKEVIALGNDNRWIDSCFTPSIAVNGLSVTS